MSTMFTQKLTFKSVFDTFCSIIILAALYMSVYDKLILTHKFSVRQQNTYTKSLLPNTTHITIVACGKRWPQGVVSIKSMVIFARSPIFVHVFTDEETIKYINRNLTDIKKHFPRFFNYNIIIARYPSIVNHDEWVNIYLPCSCIRLFFPIMLPHLDRVIYVDSDTVFFRPPEHLWHEFNNFGSHQIMGVTYDHMVTPKEFSTQGKKEIPRFWPGRLQSAVLLMDFQRMRKFNWTGFVLDFHYDWRFRDNHTSSLFDQAIINMAFYFNPEKLYNLDCNWNYRPYHFKEDGHACVKAEKDGVSLLHGIVGNFQGKDLSIYKAFYWAFRDYQVGKDRLKDLWAVIETNVKDSIKIDKLKRNTKKFDHFLIHLRKYLL